MGIHGVFVILVELEKGARVFDGRDDLFQDAQFVQAAKRFSQSIRVPHQLHEANDHFGGGFGWLSIEHARSNGSPGPMFDAAIVSIGNRHQFEDPRRSFFQFFNAGRSGPNMLSPTRRSPWTGMASRGPKCCTNQDWT